jgi:hypothetical protein
MEKGLNVEVDEKAGRSSLELHVGHQLSAVYRQELFDRLYFNDQCILDQQVNDVPLANLYSLVFQW